MNIFSTFDSGFFLKHFFNETCNNIISAYLWLFKKRNLSELIDNLEIIEHALKHDTISTLLIQICCKQGIEQIEKLVRKGRKKIFNSPSLLYSLCMNCQLNEKSYSLLKSFISKGISVIAERGDKKSALNLMNRILEVDKYAAIEHESLLLESYYQTEDESCSKLAFSCIGLTLNYHNAAYIRELVMEELQKSFEIGKFKLLLATFIILNSSSEIIATTLQSFNSQINKYLACIEEELNEEERKIFYSGWNKA